MRRAALWLLREAVAARMLTIRLQSQEREHPNGLWVTRKRAMLSDLHGSPIQVTSAVDALNAVNSHLFHANFLRAFLVHNETCHLRIEKTVVKGETLVTATVTDSADKSWRFVYELRAV